MRSVTPPEQNFVGYLERTAHFCRSAATGKALTISKCVSQSHLFLEISLEIGPGTMYYGSLDSCPALWNAACTVAFPATGLFGANASRAVEGSVEWQLKWRTC